ncbi:MAG: DUF3830 family protein [Mesorhizobium sp.]|uniref:DUF3830 family protein n=1 Tax=Mesorhizobium sp. TaxID=1871066 RepID=UPI001209A889|nr:DUF3830 family protein [Mesorhizobium sp.]TIR02429.1 MAG: DUF3830 family protein [Mesorhizobium sp.]
MTELKFVRLGLRQRQIWITLRLRWDRSPWTCEAITKRLPIASQIWHAKWANNEVYTLLPVREEIYRPEWTCAYPGPGDLMYLPIGRDGIRLPPNAPPIDTSNGLIDVAYFYERGSSLIAGPTGPHLGNIFATPVDVESVEAIANACSDVWFSGAVGEELLLEAVQ